VDEQLYRLVVLGLLFFLSAFFSGTETALMAIDRLRVKYLVQKKRRGADNLEGLLEKPDRLLSAILVGNNVVNIAISVLATGLFVSYFGADKGEWLTILILTPFLLLFAEVTPKTLAAQYPEQMSFLVLGPTRFFVALMTPIVMVIGVFTRLMSHLIAPRGEPRPIISEDEIRALISVGEQTGVVAKDKRRMLHGVFELSLTRVRDVMVPRTEVVGIEVNSSFEEVLYLVQEAHHSRFPVYEENLDNVVGIIHSKEVLCFVGRSEEFSLRDLARPPYFVPESKRVETLLQAFRKKHIHLAVVVDEYGGVEGIVTLEDIFEEIVGDIQDEYDTDEVLVKELGPGHFLLDGSISLRTVNRKYDLQLSEEHATTLAGFLLRLMGTIPKEGDSCQWEGTVFTVRRVVDRRVEEVEMVLGDGAGKQQ